MKLSKVKFLDASNAQELSKEEQKLIWGGGANGIVVGGNRHTIMVVKWIHTQPTLWGHTIGNVILHTQ